MPSGGRLGDKGVVTPESREMEVVGNPDKSDFDGTGVQACVE